MEYVMPLVKKGTTFDISGHTAVVTAITHDGIECKIEGRIYILDFDKVALATCKQVKYSNQTVNKI